jgi:inner membrane protein involved in colicin E2 resistance
MSRSARRFALHYLQMVLAMIAGMIVLIPTWSWVTRGRSLGWLAGAEGQALVMATAMAVGMGVWMRLQRHRWQHILEMSASMYGAFVVLFPFLWLSLLNGAGVLLIGHVLMLVAMLVPMFLRLDVYTADHRQNPSASAAHLSRRR